MSTIAVFVLLALVLGFYLKPRKPKPWPDYRKSEHLLRGVTRAYYE